MTPGDHVLVLPDCREGRVEIVKPGGSVGVRMTDGTLRIALANRLMPITPFGADPAPDSGMTPETIREAEAELLARLLLGLARSADENRRLRFELRLHQIMLAAVSIAALAAVAIIW